MKLKVKNKKSVGSIKSKKPTGLKIAENMEIVDIDSVAPWEKNPRKNEKAIAKLADVIKIYGQRTPISVWTEDRKIYKGNTTWFAMKKAGFKKIAVVWQDFADAKEARGYAMVDNASGEWSDWDMNVLAELLQGEEFQGMQSNEITKLTGFDDKMLKGLLLSTTEMPDILPDVDLTGGVPDKADFLVIQFESREEMKKFKERLGELKHPRVVPIKVFWEHFQWIDDGAMTADASHAAGVNYGAGLKKKGIKIKSKRR